MIIAEPPKNGVVCRLDSYLAGAYNDYSRSFFQKLLINGKVFVNGRPAEKSEKITGGEEIVWYEPKKNSRISGEDIPLKIIYEDDDIIVVDKPAGMVVHPACGHFSGTLLNALLHRSKDAYYPYLVHRLDKDTTGVLVAAKNEKAKRKVIRQFQRRSVKKVYLAVVKGALKFAHAQIDAPLGRSMKNRFKIEVGSAARKESYTELKTIKSAEEFSVVELRPKTGRTHQIRAHMAYIKHPVLGDVVYGGAQSGVVRPLLHARKIEFVHPGKNEKVAFESPVPEDIKKFLND